jgi:hypothetical protein
LELQAVRKMGNQLQMEGTKIVLDLEQPLVDVAALVVPENPCTKIIKKKKLIQIKSLEIQVNQQIDRYQNLNIASLRESEIRDLDRLID